MDKRINLLILCINFKIFTKKKIISIFFQTLSFILEIFKYIIIVYIAVACFLISLPFFMYWVYQNRFALEVWIESIWDILSLFLPLVVSPVILWLVHIFAQEFVSTQPSDALLLIEYTHLFDGLDAVIREVLLRLEDSHPSPDTIITEFELYLAFKQALITIYDLPEGEAVKLAHEFTKLAMVVSKHC